MSDKEILFQKQTKVNGKEVLMIIDEDTLKALSNISEYFCVNKYATISIYYNNRIHTHTIRYDFNLDKNKDKIIVTATIDLKKIININAFAQISVDSQKFYNTVFEYLFQKQIRIDEDIFFKELYSNLVYEILEHNILCIDHDFQGIGFIKKDNKCITTYDNLLCTSSLSFTNNNCTFVANKCVGNVESISTQDIGILDFEFYVKDKVIKFKYDTAKNLSAENNKNVYRHTINGVVNTGIVVQDSNKIIKYVKFEDCSSEEEFIEERTKFFNIEESNIEITDDFIL